MDVEEALRVADDAVFTKTKEHLSDIQKCILQGSWQGQKYEQIAETSGYTRSHIGNEGSELWKLLSVALGEKVTKTNFRAALERQSHSAEVSLPQEEVITNSTSEEETRQPLRLRLEPLTERVRAWQLEEESPDQQLDALVGITSDDPNFVGRGKAIAHLYSLINEGAKVILIQAEGGVGKTTLARQWFELQGLKPLELGVGITSQNIQSPEDWVRLKLRNDFKESPETNFLTMLEQLKSKLQQERIGILINNLETALTNGQFIEPHNNYVELLTVLAHPTVQSVTLITSREPPHEPGLAIQTVQTYPLEGLNIEAWQQYFDSRHISKNFEALHEMHHAYGGNAEVMSILSGDIQKQSQGNLETYWQHNRDDLLRHPTLEKL